MADKAQDVLLGYMQGRDTRWYRGHLGRLNLICFLILITSMTNGYDGSMMNVLQSLDLWQDYFGHPTGGLLGLFNAIQSIGGFASLPFAAGVADRYGRRFAIFFGCCIMLVATAIQTASQDIAMFICARLLIGFGLGFAATGAPMLITELAFPTHRAPVTSLYNTTWYLGAIVAAWATFGTFPINNNWSWRIPSLLQGLPSVIQVALIYTIPESPRWLVDKGRDQDAIDVLCKYHCGGNTDDPLIQFEYEEIKAAIALEKEGAATSWVSLFKTPGNLKRMRIIIALAFFSQWSGNGLVSYYLSKVLNGIGITDAFTQTLINGILQIFNYATAILGALLVDKVGRRTLWLGGIFGMLIFFSCQTACSAIYANSVNSPTPNAAAGHAVIAFIFLYYASYNFALNGILVSYTIEILPYKIRAKGFIVFSFAIDLSLIFNQYVNPIALEKLAWKYYLVYVGWLAFELAFIWRYMIETKGKDGPLSLEEIAALFDGEQNKVAAIAEEHMMASGHDREGEDEKKGGEFSHQEHYNIPVGLKG